MKNIYRKQKRISLLLVCALLIMVLSGMTAAAQFTDTESHWAKAAVDRWSGYEILKGYDDGTFRPNGNITRAEMAVVLDRLFCYQTRDTAVFADVEDGSWYADAVYHLSAAGIMKGDGVNAYPHSNITREEAAVMVARAFSFVESGAALSYSDTDQISDWAIGYIRTMSEKGYMQGSDDKFRPKGNLTRAEAVTILDNIVGAIYRTSDTPYSGVWSADCDKYVVITAQEGVTLKEMAIGGGIVVAECVRGDIVLENVTLSGPIVNLGSAEIIEKTIVHDGTFDSYHGYVLPLFSNVPKNTLDPNGFYTDDSGAAQYSGTEVQTVQGIDVSYAQGERGIDWAEVAASDIDFVMVQVGFRGWGSAGSLNVDSYFESNIAGALEAGLDVGVYFFSQATSMKEALEEAEFILPYLQKYNITYPVVFDWETIANEPDARTNGMDGQTVTNCANAFCRRIEEAGYTPMVYFNQAAGYMTYDLSVLANYDFWFAHYSSQPDFQYRFDIWQYTQSGTVPGVTGAVDRNIRFIYK